MWTTVLYATGASLPLLVGAVVGVRWQPPPRLLASTLVFAAGALIVSASFGLFEPAYRRRPGSTRLSPRLRRTSGCVRGRPCCARRLASAAGFVTGFQLSL